METTLDNKTVVEHDDTRKNAVEPLVSAYADWSTFQVIKKFPRLYFHGFLVSISGIYLGYTLQIPGSVIVNEGFIQQFGTVVNSAGQLELNAQHVSIWSAVNFASQVLFQFLSPFTATRFGLLFNLYLLTLFIVIAIILEIVARNWWVYMISKIIAGFAGGFIATSIMAYASEIAKPQMRGSLLSAFALTFAIGQVASAIALEIIQQTDPSNYKKAFYSEFAILGIWVPILLWLPESPVWLYKKGKHAKAKKSWRKLIGNVEGYDFDHEYAVIAQEVDESLVIMEKSSKIGIIACFKGANLRRTLISTIPLSMQNFVGGPIMFNAAYFFSQVGYSNSFQANLIVSCILIIGVCCSFYLVDKVGRRPLLLYGGTIMAILTLIVGSLGTTTITPQIGAAMVAMCSLWVFAYALSCGPIGWVCMVELSTPMLRAQTAGIAAVLQSCSGVVFSYCVPLLLSTQYAGLGAKVAFIFSGLGALATVIVWFAIPETKGRTYSELDELFERRVPAWRFKSERTAVQDARDTRAEGVAQ